MGMGGEIGHFSAASGAVHLRRSQGHRAPILPEAEISIIDHPPLQSVVVDRRQTSRLLAVVEQTGDPHRGTFLPIGQIELQTAGGAIAVTEDRFVGIGLLAGGDHPLIVAQHHLDQVRFTTLNIIWNFHKLMES
jgi:hypothetical protein